MSNSFLKSPDLSNAYLALNCGGSSANKWGFPNSATVFLIPSWREYKIYLQLGTIILLQTSMGIKHFGLFRSLGYASHSAILAFTPGVSEPMLVIIISLDGHVNATEEDTLILRALPLGLPGIPFLFVPVEKDDRYLPKSLHFTCLGLLSPSPLCAPNIPNLLRASLDYHNFLRTSKERLLSA